MVDVDDENESDGDPPGVPVAILRVVGGRWCGGVLRLSGQLVDGRFRQSNQLARSPAVRFQVGGGVITGLSRARTSSTRTTGDAVTESDSSCVGR